MDLALTTGAAIVKTIGSVEYRFPRLTMGELARLLESLRAKRRAQLVARLDECNLAAKERFEKLTEFDEREYTLGTGVIWTFSPGGLGSTIGASMAKNTDGQRHESDLPFSPYELHVVAAELWGERPKIDRDEDKPAEVGHDPLTQTPVPGVTTPENVPTA